MYERFASLRCSSHRTRNTREHCVNDSHLYAILRIACEIHENASLRKCTLQPFIPILSMDGDDYDDREREHSQSSVELYPDDSSSGTWTLCSDSERTLIDSIGTLTDTDDDTASLRTLVDSDSEEECEPNNDDTLSIHTLLDSDDDCFDFMEEESEQSLPCMPIPSVSSCSYIPQTPMTSCLCSYEREDFDLMVIPDSFRPPKEELFHTSKPSERNKPLVRVSPCLFAEETPGTFALVVKEQEHFSFMLDSKLLLFYDTPLDVWNSMDTRRSAFASPLFDTENMSDFEINRPLLQLSPLNSFSFDNDAQNDLFRAIDTPYDSNTYDAFFDVPSQSQYTTEHYDYDEMDTFKEPSRCHKKVQKKKRYMKYKTVPLRPFTPFSGSDFRMWNYGCEEPVNKSQNELHRKFLLNCKRPKHSSYRCYYCMLRNLSCDSAPGNGKCSNCMEKSSGLNNEIICMFDEFTYKER